MNANELTNKRCRPCEGGVPPLTPEKADELLAQLDGWAREGGEISRTYTFKNYFRTMSFVNAVVHVANREDHHPDLLVTYDSCKVTFTTHSIGGLSENDFICAAKIDTLAE